MATELKGKLPRVALIAAVATVIGLSVAGANKNAGFTYRSIHEPPLKTAPVGGREPAPFLPRQLFVPSINTNNNGKLPLRNGFPFEGQKPEEEMLTALLIVAGIGALLSGKLGPKDRRQY
jgi:hypothetical protein